MPEYAETLVSPDGRTVVARSPGEYNDLVYGLGYRKPAQAEPEPDTPVEESAQPEPASDPPPGDKSKARKAKAADSPEPPASK